MGGAVGGVGAHLPAAPVEVVLVALLVNCHHNMQSRRQSINCANVIEDRSPASREKSTLDSARSTFQKNEPKENLAVFEQLDWIYGRVAIFSPSGQSKYCSQKPHLIKKSKCLQNGDCEHGLKRNLSMVSLQVVHFQSFF